MIVINEYSGDSLVEYHEITYINIDASFDFHLYLN